MRLSGPLCLPLDASKRVTDRTEQTWDEEEAGADGFGVGASMAKPPSFHLAVFSLGRGQTRGCLSQSPAAVRLPP